MAQNYHDLEEWIDRMDAIRHDLEDLEDGQLAGAYNIVANTINHPMANNFLAHPDIRRQIPDGINPNAPLAPDYFNIARLATNYYPLQTAHNWLQQLLHDIDDQILQQVIKHN